MKIFGFQVNAVLWRGASVSGSLLLSSLVFIIAYRSISVTFGIEAIGLWGILATFVQYGRSIDLGASAAVLHSVSRAHHEGRHADVRNITTTALHVSAAAAVVSAIAVSLILFLYVGYTGAAGIEPNVYVIICVNAGTLVFMNQSGVLNAAIDAHDRADLRAYLALGGSILFGAIALVTVPQNGILGLAIAQAVQWVAIWVGAKMVLWLLNPTFRTRGSRSWFGGGREIIRLGWQFQVGSLIAALLDPLTRVLMVDFAGLAAAGRFEVVMRVVAGARNVFANGFQVLSPAAAKATGIVERNKLLDISRNIAFSLATIYAFVLLLWFPVVIEYVDPMGAAAGPELIIVLAWAFNLSACPAYFFAIGISAMDINMKSHLMMVGGVIALGSTLGFALGETGVIVGYSISVAISSLFLIFLFDRRFALRSSWIALQSTAIPSLALPVLLAGWYGLLYTYPQFVDHIIVLVVLTALGCGLALAILRRTYRGYLHRLHSEAAV